MGQIKLETVTQIKSELVTRTKLAMMTTGLVSDTWSINGQAHDSEVECLRWLLWKRRCRDSRRRLGPYLGRIPYKGFVKQVPGGINCIGILGSDGVWVFSSFRYTVWPSVIIDYSYIWVHRCTLLLHPLERWQGCIGSSKTTGSDEKLNTCQTSGGWMRVLAPFSIFSWSL